MRLYLAGMETTVRSYNYPHEKYVDYFYTYYYKSFMEYTFKNAKKPKECIVTIDSGAHSFFGVLGNSISTQYKSNRHKMPDPHAYFEDYLETLMKYYDEFDYFVELDIQEIVGMKTIKKWRERIINSPLGKKCIMVQHSYNNMDDYYWLIDNVPSRYIALEGIRGKRINMPYKELLKIAYQNSVAVHGFALTNSTVLKHYPFTTVDSSTWTSGSRYGTLHYWDRKHMSLRSVTKKQHYEKFKIDISMFNKDNGKEMSRRRLAHQAKQFMRMRDSFTEYWENHGVCWREKTPFLFKE